MATSDNDGHSTRDKILIAAATMIGEDPTARLSVRAVAARAGVSTGSLRHFFPTQQNLLDTVVAGMYDVAFPGDPLRDRDRPAVDRLVACLQQILALFGTGDKARAVWRSTFQAYVATQPSDGAVATYLALERDGRRRIEQWLAVLTDEGAIPAGDDDRRARFLGTVVNGLAIERALPADGPRLAFEEDTLRRAVLGVVHDDAPDPAG
ncbi:TetR/AcrR family transcriptional regulator [Isoptericola sp. S6320L]|uniref:TetR/AcrR family transcriptional regulator n=1 Tax=Isoptericola sp. S6320L TaxID=2926411 RepID=UPI001FF57A48|nr:TetR/AcrR family transcriptional regulator [Isoptericola sp. S6320L]MCK0116449.1 TetR/AcrR family transcriptional regulator [Isoptericola sp. S6320L]